MTLFSAPLRVTLLEHRFETMSAAAMLAHASDFDFQSALDLVNRLQAKRLRPNVLVICPAGGGGAVARRMAAISYPPVHSCTFPGALTLPADANGTLIMHDVAELTRKQQAALVEWLNTHHGRVQVIAVSEAPLDARVRDGRFDTVLYYRLNTIRVP